MSYPLALALREGTQQAHTLTENTVFMKGIGQGIVARAPMCLWLSRLYYIYDALEVEMQRCIGSAAVRVIHFPSLERLPQLEADLAFYFGVNWRDQIQQSPKTIRYVMRIHAIVNDSPELLIAHAYVRYMGDLSGGQGLKRLIRSALDLPDTQGTAFFEFAGLPTATDRKDFKCRYRDALNSLSLDITTVQNIVHEANIAFRLNQGILKELDPFLRRAIGPDTFEQLAVSSPQRSLAPQPRETAQLAMT